MGDMKMLRLSRFVGAVPKFLDGMEAAARAATSIAYVDDAAQPLEDEPFAKRERAQFQDLGHTLVPVTIGDVTVDDLSTVLDGVDAIYVAGGMADHLLDVLRHTETDAILADRVRAGLPYIGVSAGAIIMGTSIDPAIALDGPTKGVSLEDYSGLGLVDAVILPHADGLLPPIHRRLSLR
ncbi:Type 1 glutamine amidotransferase-like domain-containing protein [Paeniglutamicibacter antarcticus]|uniref:Dipeptidase E n=1 Tax=Paeniglutamicibacter antarcticus TaxID=494023 RepID=A0ABP9TMC3_9MICC